MNPPMVNIVWLDTNEVSLSAWQSKEELLQSKFCTVDSLGYLIADKEDCIIIAADKDRNNEDDFFGRSQVIPKGVIKDIQYLTYK
tara:strand:+ start:328 stop:582 length:255 start_codon:yes stop_codon:yes gene_type:complete